MFNGGAIRNRQVHFDKIRELQKGRKRLSAQEIIKSDTIAFAAQLAKSFQKNCIRFDTLKNFKNHAFRRKGFAVVVQQQSTFEVYKGKVPAHQFVHADFHQRIDENLCGGSSTIGE